MRLLLILIVGVLSNNTTVFSFEWRQAGNSIVDDAIAPSRATDILIVGSSATLLAYAFARGSNHQALVRTDLLGSTEKVFYKAGLGLTNLVYISSAVLWGVLANDQDDRDASFDSAALMFRSTLYTALVTSGIKAMRFEQRPNGNPDFASFPSGHSSNAFAFAGVVHRRHGLNWGIPAYALAVITAYSRIDVNAHYLHDVIFGGTIGLAYAFGLNEKRFWIDATSDKVAVMTTWEMN